MKRVLFIIQSYPSERSANVLCDEKVMKELVLKKAYFGISILGQGITLISQQQS